MDESYWKMSKKESKCHHIPRSFSTKNSSTFSNNGSPAFSRSSSQRTPTAKSSLLPRSVSQRSSNLARKCTNLAKEQKARFYIMKRCVAMLVCWNKHGDS